MPSQKMQETHRVEAFIDGVFAIAITLLVLEFKVPSLAPTASNLELLRGLVALWPSLLAFLASFAAILIMWVNHHGFFRLLDGVNTRFLYANGFLLLLITFVPFPTAVLASYLDRPGAHMAAAAYCGTHVLINLAYNLLWYTAARRRQLIKDQVPQQVLQRVRLAYLLAFPVYLTATALSLWQPYLGLLLCSSLWVLWAQLDYTAEPP
ncbi:MAG TPA: TMEM175 family protein [Armatimonadota bacterium]|jgi:uncharacterized membrane protein